VEGLTVRKEEQQESHGDQVGGRDAGQDDLQGLISSKRGGEED